MSSITAVDARSGRGRKGQGSIYQRRDGLFVGQLVQAGKKSVVYGRTYEGAQAKLAGNRRNEFECGQPDGGRVGSTMVGLKEAQGTCGPQPCEGTGRSFATT